MGIHFGVDYYPEHWPRERWETDARLMKEMGVQVVRMAEFSWFKMEPAEGEFDFRVAGRRGGASGQLWHQDGSWHTDGGASGVDYSEKSRDPANRQRREAQALWRQASRLPVECGISRAH